WSCSWPCSASICVASCSAASRADRNCCCRILVADGRAVSSNNFGIEPSARLGRPPLGCIVHMHDAKTHAVAQCPLEVVQQRPYEIPADVHALCNDVAHGAN